VRHDRLGGLINEYAWFREVGKTRVFWGVLGARALLAVGAGVGTGAFLVANLWVVARAAEHARLRDAASDKEAVAPDHSQGPNGEGEEDAVFAFHASGNQWRTSIRRQYTDRRDVLPRLQHDLGFDTRWRPVPRVWRNEEISNGTRRDRRRRRFGCEVSLKITRGDDRPWVEKWLTTLHCLDALRETYSGDARTLARVPQLKAVLGHVSR